MTDNQLPNFVRHLLNRSAYPHAADEIKLTQTHISYVLLAGDFVYKFKKPVDFGFLDFTTLEKRKHFCEQELKLNRRLCPSLYLDLVTINEDAGALVLNGKGKPVEYGIKMVRMPEDRMMVNIIRSGMLTEKMIDDIVSVLVPFYQTAACTPEITEFGSSEAVGVNVIENFDQTRQFVGGKELGHGRFDLISQYARDFLKRDDIFRKRIAAGRIRDCHGDLYSANICLADQVYIYDCIEFNQRFRFCDVASDVAFLAMDLDFHGLGRLAGHFVTSFKDASKDESILEVLNFYKCYRAYVRGKIGLFTSRAPEVDQATREESLKQAGQYFTLAERYASNS